MKADVRRIVLALSASARLLSDKLRVRLDRPIRIDYKAGGTPEDFRKSLMTDRNRWAPIGRAAGIEFD